MKVFVVLDGIGDLPCPSLSGKTPLEAASTPHLDSLVKKGNLGYVYPAGRDVAPESDVAVTALLGNDLRKVYTGRGPLEAFGAGIPFKPGNLVLRTNFATVNSKFVLMDRRAGRTLTTKEAEALAKTINKEVDLEIGFRFVPTVEHRGILVLEGNLSANVSNVDPAYERKGVFGVARSGEKDRPGVAQPLDPKPETRRSARLVNEFVRQSYEILKDHPVNKKRMSNFLLPANIMLPRDGGTCLPILEKKEGWTAVVSMPLERGIAKVSGMRVVSPVLPPVTGDLYGHLYKTLKLTIAAGRKVIEKEKYAKYYVHVKETDIPGHDNRPKDKKRMIELLDEEFFSVLKELGCEMLVTGDHSTPCGLKRHSADPVPLLWNGSQKKDKTLRFTEREALKGALGRMYGREVLVKVGF